MSPAELLVFCTGIVDNVYRNNCAPLVTPDMTYMLIVRSANRNTHSCKMAYPLVFRLHGTSGG